MRVFSYIVAHDTGFAPNPFHGWCTLACCKPKIRGQAEPGDLVIGLTSRSERICFMLQVGEAMSFAEYWSDSRFRAKRPDWTADRIRDRCGDNIYQSEGDGYSQRPSFHWDHETGRENPAKMHHDTSVDRILAGREFVYYGAEGPTLPPELSFLQVTRGHRSRFKPEQVEAARRFFAACPRSVQGRPAQWVDRDTSWRSGCA